MGILVRFGGDQSGAVAIEYGLIAALMSVAIITVLGSIGPRLGTTIVSVSSALK